MAIAFARVSIHTRAKGHSAVAAASYRSATKLYDERTGITHNFSNRHDVVFSAVLLPEGVNAKFQNREFLWNEVERAENRRDAQLCKDIVLALPKELTKELQIELTQRFAQMHFVENGLPADIAIHDHGDGNPHAHILVSTRRLEKNGFSKYKARDLNPAFANKFIVEKEYWGEKWRDFQNEFFKDHQLDLSVDINHVLSEKHQGRLRFEEQNYLREENELIQTARAELAVSNPELFIHQIMQTHSVFTRRDIERLVFKTFAKTNHANDYLNLVVKILEHKNIVNLGKNDRGFEAYTTREHYMKEGELLQNVEDLLLRKSHVTHQSLNSLINHYLLNEEQSEALEFITQGEDISVLIGRPGVGKSYLLKPLKEYYEASHYQVLGASLSGKVAKTLQAETGITSSTIASLVYRLETGKLHITKEHVLIIDEAGMVDFSNMAFLLNAVNKAHAKIILIGDPDQLKPIHKGEIFRGIANRTGYIELENIRRQHDSGDRKASIALARGQIDSAIQHYASKKAIHLSEDVEAAAIDLVNQWQADINAESIKEHIMLAFTRKAVEALNNNARMVLKEKGLIEKNEFYYFSQNGSLTRTLACGERILLRQNDQQLGVRNGDLGTIIHINANEFTAILDSGERVTIPKSYRFIDYGYALTVHKAQGMTVDHASILIDSAYWDKNLAFVAMTRHRESLKIYANKEQHPDLDLLIQTLSRSTIKDNVIDWPLDFALRAGFDSDTLIGKAINSVGKTTTAIKDTWNYIVNYESYLNAQELKNKFIERRTTAHEVAELLDEAADLRKQFKKLEKEIQQKRIASTEHPLFGGIFNRSLVRDEKAANLFRTQNDVLENTNKYQSKSIESLKGYAARFARYQTLNLLAVLPRGQTIPKEYSENIASIDLEKDYYLIQNTAATHNQNPKEFSKKISQLQKEYQLEKWNELKKTYFILARYEELSSQCSKVNGYKKEQLNKSLNLIAKEITNNQNLVALIKNDVPKIALKIQKNLHDKNIHELLP